MTDDVRPRSRLTRGPYAEPIQVERRRVVGEHTHRQPRWPILILSVLLIFTTVAVVVLSFYVVNLASGTRQQVVEVTCEVLDELPAGRLDPIREQYDCGPGAPRNQEVP